MVISTEQHLLRDTEVAKLLAVSVATVRRWRLLQHGPRFFKVGRASVRYSADDVAAWLASRPSGGGQQMGVRL